MNAFLQGIGIGAGLIIAIGAQNAFVLTQGIRKQHHRLIALICSASDMLLIFLGAAGVGAVVAANPVWQKYAAWLGAMFLFWLGLKALLGALTKKKLAVRQEKTLTRQAAILTTLALTFLNPHVYLDTVLLLGGLGGQYPPQERYLFALGASVSSFLWFFSLAIGGTFLAPLFLKSTAWKILDLVVCATMWSISWQLLVAFD
jgi:L-lysine exporter family protein LysE/ArgO